jgi:hypothetical protein
MKGENMRKKIENFFAKNGFGSSPVGIKTIVNPDGASFYNDGTYKEKTDLISNGEKYFFLHDKITGRPFFSLTDMDTGKWVAAGSSQDRFIKECKQLKWFD